MGNPLDDAGMGGVLAGLRVLDVSLLGPAILSMQLADLGADVVKVEPPGGDYIRKVGWPVIDGATLLHWHSNRGKRSVVLDLTSEDDIRIFLELVKAADVLVEGMRPGALERRGLGWERLREANPKLVYCSISGFGSTGPLAQLATHGAGFDSWAGLLVTQPDEHDRPSLPEARMPIGYFAGPLWGAIGVLAGVLRARATGQGFRFEISQAGAAAATGAIALSAQQYVNERKAAGEDTGGAPAFRGSVRLAIYKTNDGHVLFMATERKFWKNFCEAIARPDLYAAYPGKEDYDHEQYNRELRDELDRIFATRTMAGWVELGLERDFPIVQVHTPASLLEDEHFLSSAPWQEADHPTKLLATPIRPIGEPPAKVRRAPRPGEHTAEVLKDWLGR